MFVPAGPAVNTYPERKHRGEVGRISSRGDQGVGELTADKIWWMRVIAGKFIACK